MTNKSQLYKKQVRCKYCNRLNDIDIKRIDMISPKKTGGTMDCKFCGKFSGFVINDGDMWFGIGYIK